MQLRNRVVSGLRRRGPLRLWEGVVSAVEDELFDLRHRIETRGPVPPNDLDIAEEDKLHSIGYLPTRVRYFRKLTQAQPLPTDFTFIDIGCGKGRILMTAAEYGFRRIIGIDISPRLCELARRNVETYRRRTATPARFRIECTTVLRTELDHTRQVFYLYQPFDRMVMGGFLDKLRTSLRTAPRKVWMIINQMECRDLFEQDDLFIRRRRMVYGAGEFDVYYHEPRRPVA